ncbi:MULTISPECIES: DUF2570 domain-containing protein [Pseudomonas]|uniref:DUF2570 domain-containing protein n=1 Tax=Pseudomonas TaxID=286 RepID=UPI000B353A40|nr:MULTISPECIES: DUF2570 domain-containing protein [Pseudomonas]PMY33057.1 DUF2570 domain-containing protein [Pseudomonas sp. GW456-L14]PMY50021.1 DUF2570 domain-containing protein [Pseudomonas sp. GW456-L12]PMY64837.1 DUF2570 domain-containing protein [Pseudomonas sp. FW305-25]PMY69243.1 DUF2570 domain-containing protein [Pseudomonas sp. FW126-L8]PNA80068.1 DUF2570 domain-containing protein [Pseudomonas sp. FW305-76]
MSWLLRNWSCALLGVGAIVIGGLWLQLRCEQADVRTLQQENLYLTEQRDEAQAQLEQQLKTLRFFDQITQATENAKLQRQQQSEQVQSIIKTVLVKESCAREPVPAAVVERLRQHAEHTHTTASNSAARQPAG